MITRSLKYVLLMAITVGIQGAVEAAVNMISVEHRVWGDAGDSPSNYYDGAGPAPMSRSVSHNMWDEGYDFDRDGPWVGEFFVASSSASHWSIHAERGGFGHLANAYAQNTYVFQPLSRQLTISLGGEISEWWFENDAQMLLTDLNTNSLISIYQSPSYFYPQSPFPPFANDMADYPVIWDATVEVNPEHDYELIIFVGAHRGEGGHGSASLNLTLAPEPGTTLLAGMAVLLACGRRQRPRPK